MKEYSVTVLPKREELSRVMTGSKTMSVLKTAVRKVRVMPRRTRRSTGVIYEHDGRI